MLDLLLKTHEETSNIDFREMWQNGVFVFDSNVLLDLYRLPQSARDDLLSVLENESFNEKIWIGYQVMLEFLNNRHDAIGDQKQKFDKVRKILNDSIDKYDGVFNQLQSELSKLRLRDRHSSINPDDYVTQENIEGGKQFLYEFMNQLDTLDEKQADVNEVDYIKEKVIQIFNGKIGCGLTEEKIEEVYKEGEERFKNKVPPGYKDNDKDGHYLVGDTIFKRKFGDLLLWKEILEKVEKEDVSHLVLVTGDGKEDWWLEKKGKRLGPRRELLNEIYFKGKKLELFHMYDTGSFLKFATEELGVNIHDSSIDDIKHLMELHDGGKGKTAFQDRIVRLSSKASLSQSNLKDIFIDVLSNHPSIKIIRFSSIVGFRFLEVDDAFIAYFIKIIFDYVENHSSCKEVVLQKREEAHWVDLIMKFDIGFDSLNTQNARDAEKPFNTMKHRLSLVIDVLEEDYGFQGKVIRRLDNVTVTLNIPSNICLT